MNKTILRIALLAFALMLGAGVLFISVVPLDRIALGTRPAVGASLAMIQRAALLHFAVHILFFGTLACLVWYSLDFAAAGRINKLTGLVSVLLLGCGTEYLQHRLYDIPLEVGDVCTNLLAALIVFGLLWRSSQNSKSPAEAELKGEHVAYVLRDLE